MKNETIPGGIDPLDPADAELLADFESDYAKMINHRGEEIPTLQKRIAEMTARREAGKKVDNKSLAQDHLTLALEEQEEERLDNSLNHFDAALAILIESSADDSSPEIRQMIGVTRLGRAVVLNDFGRSDEALEEYRRAAESLRSLEEEGVEEARLDTGGIYLNIATIYFEQGDLDTAAKNLAEAKNRFEAVQSSDHGSDARFYLAKSSELAASIFLGKEDVEKEAEAIDQSIDLYRNLRAEGQRDCAADLAKVLCVKAELPKLEDDFKSQLKLVTEAVELFQEAAANGQMDACFSLLETVAFEGQLLNQNSRFDETICVINPHLEVFATLEAVELSNPLFRLADLYETRAEAFFLTGDASLALAGFTKGIELRKKGLEQLAKEERDHHQEEEEDAEDGEGCCDHCRQLRVMAEADLMTVYGNRAKAQVAVGDRDSALADCREAKKRLESLRDYFGDDYEKINRLFRKIRNQAEKMN